MEGGGRWGKGGGGEEEEGKGGGEGGGRERWARCKGEEKRGKVEGKVKWGRR